MNDESYLAKKHILKPNMAKNDEQFNVHESELFEIIQNGQLFEFLRTSCTMVLGVQNPFWICGSHQNLILMEMSNKTNIFKHCFDEFDILNNNLAI